MKNKIITFLIILIATSLVLYFSLKDDFNTILNTMLKINVNDAYLDKSFIYKGEIKMSYEVRNFIEKIVFAVVAFAALCLFCFDIMGAVAQPLSFLALLFPILGVVLYIIPTPDFTK